MFTSENHEGCLIELRIASPVTADEIAEMQRVHLATLQRIAGNYVAAVDLRQAFVFPAEISERLIALMGQLNPRLLRSAWLINSSAVLGLQAERAIQEAGHPNRRTFREPEPMELWLSEVLTPAEQARLHQFLTVDPSAPSTAKAAVTVQLQ